MTTASNALSASAVSARGRRARSDLEPLRRLHERRHLEARILLERAAHERGVPRRPRFVHEHVQPACRSATKRRSAALSASVVSPSAGRTRSVTSTCRSPAAYIAASPRSARSRASTGARRCASSAPRSSRTIRDDLPASPLRLDDGRERRRPADANRRLARLRQRCEHSGAGGSGDGDGRDGHAVTDECGRWSRCHQPRPRRPARPRSRTSLASPRLRARRCRTSSAIGRDRAALMLDGDRRAGVERPRRIDEPDDRRRDRRASQQRGHRHWPALRGPGAAQRTVALERARAPATRARRRQRRGRRPDWSVGRSLVSPPRSSRSCRSPFETACQSSAAGSTASASSARPVSTRARSTEPDLTAGARSSSRVSRRRAASTVASGAGG